MEILTGSYSIWFIIGLTALAGCVAYLSGKLTLAASVTGSFIAFLIYLGAGLAGVILLAVFFILGTAATSYKKDYKLAMRLAETHGGRRTMNQVLANGGVGAILALLSILIDYTGTVLQVMIAGSLASATGDTLSSELGNVYGRNFYNILSFRKDERGLDGVISLEGTLFGIFGSVIIALVYSIAYGWSFAFFVILIAGVAGNLFDSVLGALFERQGWLGNDAVNFMNTAFAALIAFLLTGI
jgi:uncharacterized protein (TIGR00297 family)